MLGLEKAVLYKLLCLFSGVTGCTYWYMISNLMEPCSEIALVKV